MSENFRHPVTHVQKLQKNSYFPLRAEPLVGYKLSRVALGTRMGFKCLAESNILLMRKRNHAFLVLAIALSSRMADRFASRRYLLKQLLNSVIAKYRDFSVSRSSDQLFASAFG